MLSTMTPIGPRRSRTALLVAVALAASVLGTTATAHGADAVAPADGAIVSSAPTFAFDFAVGIALVEVAVDPAVKTSGEDAGAFVAPVASDLTVLTDRRPQDGLAPWQGDRLNAGRYVWHVFARDDSRQDGNTGAWTPTRSFVVADEPPAFGSWRVRAKRLKRKTRACPNIVRVYGAVSFTDNDAEPAAELAMTLRVGGKRTEIRDDVTAATRDFSALVCTKHTRFAAEPALRDIAGNVATGPTRRVTVRR